MSTKLAKLNTRKEPLSGDITVRRKEDKIQLVREPKIVLCTLDAETGIKMANELFHQADIILKATSNLEE